MAPPIILTSGLTRRFGETLAVADLTLEVYAGEIFGFLGHNGAGKTTTVRMLNGVLASNAGSARVLGLDPQADGPALRRRTGVLTETPSLDERLTAHDNLRIYADLFGVPRAEVNRRVEELLAIFELADRADEKVGGYSKGMKQRLALARALLHRPELLFLDEPTTGLDPLAARRVRDMIAQQAHQQGHAVFMCTHNLVEAQRLCDRVAVMEQGRLVALGTPAELARRLVRNLRLEIEVLPEQMAQAQETLRALPALARGSITTENGGLAVGGISREAIPELLAGLVQSGVRIYKAAAQEPSLEDVYFALHDQAEIH